MLLVGSYRSSLNTPTHPKPPDWSFEDFWEKFIAFWYLFLLDFFLPSDISDKHWHQLSKAEVSRLTFLGLIISHEKNFNYIPNRLPFQKWQQLIISVCVLKTLDLWPLESYMHAWLGHFLTLNTLAYPVINLNTHSHWIVYISWYTTWFYSAFGSSPPKKWNIY